jgi:hypothetical protein
MRRSVLTLSQRKECVAQIVLRLHPLKRVPVTGALLERSTEGRDGLLEMSCSTLAPSQAEKGNA